MYNAQNGINQCVEKSPTWIIGFEDSCRVHLSEGLVDWVQMETV